MNAARGEAEAMLAGERVRLCLTLGALAEIETRFGTEGAEALAGRLRRLSAEDLGGVLAALLKGGGATQEEAERLAGTCTPGDAARAVAAAFEAST